MRSFAAAALLLIVVAASPNRASAQIPYVQIYFDKNLQETQAYCPGVVVDTFQVVAINFAMFLSTIEFSILPPQTELAWIGDLHLDGSLHLGESATGVTITYPIPLNAFRPAIVMRYRVLWLCDACGEYGPTVPLRVDPHTTTGLLQAIEWNTFRTVQGVGMTALVCPVFIGTEPTTWGRVKSLYQ